MENTFKRITKTVENTTDICLMDKEMGKGSSFTKMGAIMRACGKITWWMDTASFITITEN